ncbi:hypothetical protein [Rhodococcus sp. WB9]|nr:hypothetical protein [Rhodococcus sp. WB9]
MFENYWTELNLLDIGKYTADEHLDKSDAIDAIRRTTPPTTPTF